MVPGFYSSPSCDGDRNRKVRISQDFVSILPRLATGIDTICNLISNVVFLFFPVLRRGSVYRYTINSIKCFYSSPSCDGDLYRQIFIPCLKVSILPRLATGIQKQ